MSYDDDEALFEDIYGEDDVKEKQSTEVTSASTEASTDQKTAAVPPPPPAPPAIPAPTAESANSIPSAPPVGHTGQFNTAESQSYGSNIGSAPAPAAPQPSYVHQPSSVGKESGKMFIGGLNWDTTEEKLVAYFSKFGEVLDHTIMRDGNTGKSRGFGFLTFKEPRSVDAVIKTDHVLDGKLIDPKRAIAREEQDRVGKIFVGGIDPMVNERDFNEFFSQFGSIIDAQLMIDKDTGRSRGFGFITYDSPDAVDRVTVNKYLTLKGKTMEVKRAEPRGQHQQNQLLQQQQQQQQQQQSSYGANNGYNYANQYGQVQQPQQQQQQQPQQPGQYQAAYGQQMTPEMMQEYWQRMQQWYMYQQQVAQGQEGVAAEQPVQPMNPQQQSEEDQSDASAPQAQSIPQAPAAPHTPAIPTAPAAASSGQDDRDSRDFRGDYRRNNLPKGPRRAPPSGPAGAMRGGGFGDRGGYNGRGGRGGRGGYQRDRGGYHPYSRGGRRS